MITKTQNSKLRTQNYISKLKFETNYNVKNSKYKTIKAQGLNL